jgi:hypothetical protein
MALVGVIADSAADVTLLDLTETHYVLGEDLSFVTLEFSARTSEDCHTLTLCVHGRALGGDDHQQLFRHFRRREVRRLMHHGRVKDRPESGVYNFAPSFQYQTSTNRFYEGPAQWRAIVYRSEAELEKYGTLMKLPKYTASISESDESCSTINLAGEKGYAASDIYAFRIGFFIARPKPLQKPPWPHRLLGLPVGPYAVHTYFCPKDIAPILQSAGRLDKLRTKTRLHIRLAAYVELWNTLRPDEPMEDWRDEPHSDIWLVVPDHYAVRLLPEQVDEDSETTPRKSEYVLFPSHDPPSRPPYLESHVRLAKNVTSYRKSTTVEPVAELGTAVQWQLNDRRRPTLLAVFAVLYSALPVLGVALAISVGAAGGKITARGLITSACSYVGFAALAFLSRWVFPRLREVIP